MLSRTDSGRFLSTLVRLLSTARVNDVPSRNEETGDEAGEDDRLRKAGDVAHGIR